MSCKLINYNTREPAKGNYTVSDSDYNNWCEFDSAEEALLEIVVAKESCVHLTDKTINDINKIVKSLNVRGVSLDLYFTWRNYVFTVLGRMFGFVGEMSKETLTVHDLSKINWELYSEEERVKHFKNIYKTLRPEYTEFLPEHQINNKIVQVKNEIAIPIPENNTPNKKHEHVIYLLYCTETPNIYYVGRTQNIVSRIRTHKKISHTDSEPKKKWVEYINKNGYVLEHKILEITDDKYTIGDLENKWILKYMEDKENVVINFTTPHYNSKSDVFMNRFNACLYDKNIITVDKY